MKTDLQSEIRALTERAERAERERDRVEAEWQDHAHRAVRRAEAAEAALSRAREALESWERDPTVPAVRGIVALRAALAATPDPGPPPRCARCAEEYRSLMNPRWRGHPWECGKCGCVNPGTVAAAPGAEAVSGDICGGAWCGKPDGHKGACDSALIEWWTKRAEIEAALRETAAVLGALRYREDHAQWALPREVILAGICPEPGHLREEISAALAATQAKHMDLACDASDPAAPDPSPVAGRDEKKKLTSEDRTDGER